MAPLRPRSPDVQVYRPQLTSVLSILHRATAVWLSLGSLLLVLWLVAIAAGGGLYAAAQEFLGSWPGALLLFSWSYALFYHLCNGIRHLAWDMDYGFELSRIYLTGWLVVLASTLLTLATWLAALSMRG